MMRAFAKYALYLLLIYLLFCFQAAFAPLFAPLGAGPELLPALLGCVCTLESPLPAALLGLSAGILRDTLSLSKVYFSLLYYLSALTAALLTRRQLRPCAPAALLASCALCLLSDVQTFLAAVFLPGPGMLAALKGAGLHAAYTLVFFYPAYKLCFLLHRLAPEPVHAGKRLPLTKIRSYVNLKGGKSHALR